MSERFKNYYKNYHTTYENGGYSMDKVRHTSRVKILKETISDYCNPGHTILDIGCGDMYLAEALPLFEWTGIDVNTAMSKGRAIEVDIENPPYPFPDKSFDMIVCSEVLEHLYDLRDVHKEAHRLLKDDGYYLISTPNFDHIDHFVTHFREFVTDFNKSHLIEHIRMYTPATHEQFLEETGFKQMFQTGADAHFSGIFKDARNTMPTVIKEMFGYEINEWLADYILGLCFPKFSHTTIHLAKKKEIK